MNKQTAKELFLESQTEWLFQFAYFSNCSVGITGQYAHGATFADACFNLVVTQRQDINDFTFDMEGGMTPEEFVRAHAHGAVKVSDFMSRQLAWDTDIRGVWPRPGE